VPEPELVERIASTTGLTPGEAARVIDDVLAYYREEVREFVRRRHAAHQLRGIRNEQAYRLIADELRARLVAPPDLSERQVRRIVYG